MNKYSKDEIMEEAKNRGLNLRTIGFRQLCRGVLIEQEHPQANTLKKVMAIVIQHLEEYPDYYIRLMKMEDEAKAYYKDHPKASIYLSGKK